MCSSFIGGALFLAVVLACGYAAVEPTARRAATLVVAISVVGFLVVYVRADMPPALRGIAIADFAALGPLLFLLVSSWRRQAL